MRLALIAATALSAAACTPAPPTAVAQPATPQPAAVEPGARAIARRLFGDLARQMEARADRIVEAEERRHALGGMLAGYDLYEAPRGSAFPGLCEVTVHQVTVAFRPPQAVEGPPPPPESASVVTRYYAIGSTIADAAAPDARDGCASLPTPRGFFNAPSPHFAAQAVQSLEMAQMWSRTTPAAVVITCLGSMRPCLGNPGAFLRALDRTNIVEISEQPCAADAPGRGRTCFLYRIDQPGGAASGQWTLRIRGPERPLQVDILPFQPPVS